MRIAEICKRDVLTCSPDTSAVEIAALMRDRHVGDVVVVEERDGRIYPVGVVTDRDLVVRVLARKVDADSVKASDLLTHDVVQARDSEYVYDAIWHMRSKGVRRLPVVDADGVLCGVLSMDDITRYLGNALNEIGSISPYQVVMEKSRLHP